MAASYKIIEDVNFCIHNEIEIAAVDAVSGEIYVNSSCGFSENEWRFVLAHEFLHAGLVHHKRRQGRNHYLWNIACDYVINSWLHDMGISEMPPKGLLYDEDLKGLSMPAIPWDVELGKWFDTYFPSLEKHRTYARPSRRQSSTSGSISTKELGMALGSIASYAVSKDVPFVRVIFCDADAYDAGYLSPEDISGRVEVKGRGGTVLQPAVNLLEKTKDFPQNAPILIITDGYIENNLHVHHTHAYLLPKGNKLPFHANGKVFYFK